VLKLYDRVLDIKPNDPDAMAAKAGIYQAQGKLQEAGGILSEINWQTPSEKAFGIKIDQLRFEQNYAEAVRLLQARMAQFNFGSEYDKAGSQMVLAFTQRLAGDTAGQKLPRNRHAIRWSGFTETNQTATPLRRRCP
jgi:hypothetical protein